LKFFSNLRKIARQDAQETVDYSVYEQQIRLLVDKQVVGSHIKESEGVYVVGELGQVDPDTWTDDEARNAADVIKTRVRKTIEQSLADDPYAQRVFSELLKQAIEEAEALFDHPVKQYALFKEFEEKVSAKDLEGIPQVLKDKAHPRAYYGAMLLVLGDKANAVSDVETESMVSEALEIEKVVDKAVAEFSLNPQGIEKAINRDLLPRLFKLFGMDDAKALIEEIIHITRVGLNKES
jgi:type I restriction enzyme R subunit